MAVARNAIMVVKEVTKIALHQGTVSSIHTRFFYHYYHSLDLMCSQGVLTKKNEWSFNGGVE